MRDKYLFYIFCVYCKILTHKNAAHFFCVVSVEDSIAMQVGKQFKEADSRDYGEFNVKIYGDEKMANI